MKWNVAAVAMIAIVLAACESTTIQTPGGTIQLWPTADRLVGSAPVGRWARFDADIDYEALKKTNRYRNFNPRCFIGVWIGDRYIDRDTPIALHPNGTGWTLLQRDQERVSSGSSGWFRIAGSSTLLYKRDNEFRWSYTGGILTVQSRDQRTYSVEQVETTSFLITRNRPQDTHRLMVSIGSKLYTDIIEFGQCVRANGTRKLFDLVECQVPQGVAQ